MMNSHNRCQIEAGTHTHINSYVIAKLYFIFTILQGLMNSLGIVILKSISYFHVSPDVAGRLGFIKETISLMTLLYTARLIQKWGWLSITWVSVVIPLIGCLVMVLVPSFFMMQGLFMTLAFSFALLRIVAYSSTVKMYQDMSKQIQMLSLLEALGMLGSLAGLLIFSMFIQWDVKNEGWWINGYWVFFGLFSIGLLFAYKMRGVCNPKDEADAKPKHIQNIFVLAWKYPVSWFFLALIFFYVFLEQGLLNWLPYFYCHTVLLPEKMSCQLTILFPTYMMLGRFAFSWWIKGRSPIVSLWLLIGISLGFYLFIIIGLRAQSFENVELWANVPFFAYLVPLLGFFQAPIFSILCSLFLQHFSHLNKESLLSLIGVACAFGGGIGIALLGVIFNLTSGLGVIGVLMGILACFAILSLWCYRQEYFGKSSLNSTEKA